MASKNEYIFPSVHEALKLGTKRDSKEISALKSKYIFFSPYALNAKNSENTDSKGNAIAAVKVNDSEQQLKRGTTPSLSEIKSGLKIGLPIKPINVDLSHEYSMSDVYEISGGVSALQAMGKNILANMGKKLVEGAVESEGGKLIGLDKLKNSLLASTGISDFKPQRNMYNSSKSSPLDFTWILSPADKDEALILLQIVKIFQLYSMIEGSASNDQSAVVADFGGGGDENGDTRNPMFVKNPAMWKIEIGDTGNLPNNMFRAENKFFPMVCTKANAKFGSGDALTFIQRAGTKNFPVELSLELSFDYFMNVGYRKDFLGIKSMKDIEGMSL